MFDGIILSGGPPPLGGIIESMFGADAMSELSLVNRHTFLYGMLNAYLREEGDESAIRTFETAINALVNTLHTDLHVMVIERDLNIGNRAQALAVAEILIERPDEEDPEVMLETETHLVQLGVIPPARTD